jgi:uncharacterized protein (TIGR02246 family)
MDDDLSTRLRRLEDLVAINQVFVDYIHALDWKDPEEYAAQFTDDGEVILGPIRAKGHTEIKQALVTMVAPESSNGFHIVSNPRIAVDGDAATAEVMWTFIGRDGAGQPVVNLLGRHVDKLVRQDGRWLIQQRKGRLDIPASVGQIGASRES